MSIARQNARNAQLAARVDAKFFTEGTPYLPEGTIGTGAYGTVCKAIDQRSGERVAIKKISHALASQTLAKRTLREVRILRDLRHENIISIHDMFTAEGTNGKDIYMIMDLMETDLHQIIHSRQKLLEQHFQYFVYQILRGIKALHSAKIAHRDLKPSNLLVNGDCLLRIADFGMARCIESPEPREDDKSNVKTQYVATRWYRAPELLFSIIDYDTQVDMWSVGCIFAEMLLQRQLLPGKDAPSQVRMIVYYFGTPENAVLEKISSPTVLEWIKSCGPKASVPWNLIFPKATPQAVELIAKLLQVTPWKRATAEQALEDPYVSQYHDPRYEPICDRRVHFDADAIENLQPREISAALLAEASYYESRRGPYNTRTTPPTIADLTENEIPKEEPRFDESDRKIQSDEFNMIRDDRSDNSSSASTAQCSACSSTSTVRRMDSLEGDSSKRNSRLMDFSSSEALISNSQNFEEDHNNCDNGKTTNGKSKDSIKRNTERCNGILIPIDDASTSSAPADFQRPNYRQSIKASLERKQRENRNRNALDKVLRRGAVGGAAKKEKARATYADSLLQQEEEEAWRKAAKARSRTNSFAKRNSADASSDCSSTSLLLENDTTSTLSAEKVAAKRRNVSLDETATGKQQASHEAQRLLLNNSGNDE